MIRRVTAMAVLGLAVTALCGVLQGQTISAKRETDKWKTIRVTARGKFETTFTMRKGFVGTFFDLKNDAGKKRDLAPMADENGILWVKSGFPENVESGSYYANPPEQMELLESGPTRVRVRLSGPHMRYGQLGEKMRWGAFKYAQTWTVYPSGQAYCDYELKPDKALKMHHFLLIVKSTGQWGKQGKGEGANEVHPASECGNDTKPGSKGPASFVLQWSNGPTNFQDILLVMKEGRYTGTYWNEGYMDRDYRTGLSIHSRWKDGLFPAKGDRLLLMMRFDTGINGADAARPHAKDYRQPDKLDVTAGEVVKGDTGDHDRDGFNESEGCYVLKAGAKGVAFTLHGKATPRMDPVLKVLAWKGDAPKTVTLAEKTFEAGKGFNASVEEGTLLLQVFGPVDDDVAVSIPGAAAK